VRIVFSTDQIYLHGGIEKVMAIKANYMADILGYEVFILTTEQKLNQPCYFLSNKIQLIDIGVNYVRNRSYFSFQNLKNIPIHFFRMLKKLYEIEPNVLIICNYSYDFYWVPFINPKIKKIKEFHSSRYLYEIKRNKTRSYKDLLFFKISDWFESKYDSLLVLSQTEKEFYKTKNVVVIPNPIDLPIFSASLTSKKVIAVGRIAPVKGYDKLITAWQIVANKFPDWELHIYGEDYNGTKSQLQYLIQNAQLQNKILFKGTIDSIIEIMKDYSLCVMTSKTECFPMVLLESLSVGLPVISFNCPTGPKNIITPGIDGFLVSDQNVVELANKIIYLISNKVDLIKMGKNAKENVKFFSSECIMQQWVKLLIEIQ